MQLLLSPYTTGVSGILTCRYPKNEKALVVISRNGNYFFEKMPIARYVGYYNIFKNYGGRTWSFRRPDLYFKIIYSCAQSKTMCMYIFVKQIPPNYIFRGKKVGNFFNFGKIELSELYKYSKKFCRKKNSLE